MKKIQWALVSLGVALLAAGCGGGGGGSSSGLTIPTAAVQINTTNAPTVAKSALTPAQGLVKSGSGAAGVVGMVAQVSGHSRSILDISLAEFNRALSLRFPPAVTGVNQSVTISCSGGGNVVGTIQDRDSSNSFTVGDILTMVFHSCVEPSSIGGNSTTNGSATFSITSASGALGMGITPFSAAFTLTFSNFTNTDNVTHLTDTINGDISFSTVNDGANTTGTMSGTSLRMDNSVDGAFSMTSYSFSFTEANVLSLSSPFSFSVNMTIASVLANGSVTITTTTAFTGVGAGDPSAGEMVITGANNSALTLTALPDGVHVQIVVDNDGPGPNSPVALSNPATTTDYTWAEL